MDIKSGRLLDQAVISFIIEIAYEMNVYSYLSLDCLAAVWWYEPTSVFRSHKVNQCNLPHYDCVTFAVQLRHKCCCLSWRIQGTVTIFYLYAYCVPTSKIFQLYIFCNQWQTAISLVYKSAI